MDQTLYPESNSAQLANVVWVLILAVLLFIRRCLISNLSHVKRFCQCQEVYADDRQLIADMFSFHACKKPLCT